MLRIKFIQKFVAITMAGLFLIPALLCCCIQKEALAAEKKMPSCHMAKQSSEKPTLAIKNVRSPCECQVKISNPVEEAKIENKYFVEGHSTLHLSSIVDEISLKENQTHDVFSAFRYKPRIELPLYLKFSVLRV